MRIATAGCVVLFLAAAAASACAGRAETRSPTGPADPRPPASASALRIEDVTFVVAMSYP